MPNLICAVCIESHPLEQFRILKCGHAFCLQVLEDLRRQPPPRKICPMCRQKLTGQNDLVGTQLFLSFGDGDASSQINATVAALSVLDANVDANRVDRISQSIEDVIPVLQGDEDQERNVRKLRRALHDFKERVGPSLVQLRTLNEELALHRENHVKAAEQMNAQAAKIGRLERSCAALERQKVDAELVRDEALQAAEMATRETTQLRKEQSGLGQRATRYKEENEKLKKELKKLTDDNKRYRTLAQKYRAAEHASRKEVSRLEARLEDLERDKGIDDPLPFPEYLGGFDVEGAEPESLPLTRQPFSQDDGSDSDGSMISPSWSTRATRNSTPSRSSLPDPAHPSLFSSGWNLPPPAQPSRKRSISGVLELDKQGKPKKVASTGPKHSVRLSGGLRR